jgi:UDP-N-acetylglucosamine 3-dehydrogenase
MTNKNTRQHYRKGCEFEMKKLKVAVIGLGVMGQQHAKIYAEMPHAELVAVHDLNHDYAKRIAQQFAIKAIKNLHQLLVDPEIDAVSICTSDDQHREIAFQACEQGKAILLEKPLADTMEDAQAIVEKAEETQARLMVGHTLRWDPRYYLAREAVRAGRVGEVIHLHARRNNSYQNGKRLQGRTSVAMFLGVHDIDAIEWITGDRIVEVSAVEVRKRLREYNVADAIITTLRLASGAIGSYETSWVLPDNHVDLDSKLDITGTEGVLNIDILEQNIRLYGKGEKVTYPDTMYGIDLYGRRTGILREEITSFVDSVLNGLPFPITVHEAFRAVRIVQAIEQSAILGQPIKIEA